MSQRNCRIELEVPQQDLSQYFTKMGSSSSFTIGTNPWHNSAFQRPETFWGTQNVSQYNALHPHQHTLEWHPPTQSGFYSFFFFYSFDIIVTFFFFSFILFLNFTILYWFCQILKWIHHRYTCVPHPEPSSHLPPHTIPLGRPSAPAPCIQYRASNLDWLERRNTEIQRTWVLSCTLNHVWTKAILSSVQFSSVAQSCPTLCDPMNCSTPGLPVQHQLPEFTQTHLLWVSDAIQPSHPLSSPSPPAPNPSQHQRLSQWVSSSHEVAKVLEFQL